jgi:hypothetical protein
MYGTIRIGIRKPDSYHRTASCKAAYPEILTKCSAGSNWLLTAVRVFLISDRYRTFRPHTFMAYNFLRKNVNSLHVFLIFSLLQEGRYECICEPGYTGQDCDINVDECLSAPCLNNATCQDRVSRFISPCFARCHFRAQKSLDFQGSRNGWICTHQKHYVRGRINYRSINS